MACASIVFQDPFEESKIQRYSIKTLSKQVLTIDARTPKTLNELLGILSDEKIFAYIYTDKEGKMTNDLCDITFRNVDNGKVIKDSAMDTAFFAKSHTILSMVKKSELSLSSTQKEAVKSYSDAHFGEDKPHVLNIKSLNGKHIKIKCDMSLSDEISVMSLKHYICEEEGIPIDQMRIIFNGKQLEDHKNLDLYNIVDKSDVHLILRLYGGMFRPESGRDGTFESLKTIYVLVD